jgi:hypothetical protein
LHLLEFSVEIIKFGSKEAIAKDLQAVDRFVAVGQVLVGAGDIRVSECLYQNMPTCRGKAGVLLRFSGDVIVHLIGGSGHGIVSERQLGTANGKEVGENGEGFVGVIRSPPDVEACFGDTTVYLSIPTTGKTPN